MVEAVKILVIDDSEDDRFTYRRALQSSGCDYLLTEAESGEAGLKFIDQERPACILLDYSLPGRNGIEVLKRIRTRYPFIPVVMLTGQGNETLAVIAIHEGAQHYIAKAAVTPESLQRIVRVAIEHCAMQERIYEQRTSLEIFTRALAHDLKEPVRTIHSFLALIMRQDLPPEKTKHYFTYVQQAAERMGMMIDTIYFYMRLDNAQKIMREPCDSGLALREAQANLAALIRDRQAIISADELPWVEGNPMQLMQLFQNLLSNAIYHCSSTPVIHVSAQRDGNFWQFRLSDNGPGIAMEHREKIFEPFKRMSHSHEEGLGLGLAICKKIVTSSGGKIWCEPSLPQGASFCFTFHQAQPDNAANENSQCSPAMPLSCKDNDSIACIMIVEDNPADIELTRFALQDEAKVDCRLLICRDGSEAFALLKDPIVADKVDLILLDINMPGMDGFELLAQMQNMKTTHKTPVLMCTTSTYDKDIEKARMLGVLGYLTKPFDFVKMKDYISAIPGLRCDSAGEGCCLMRVAGGVDFPL